MTAPGLMASKVVLLDSGTWGSLGLRQMSFKTGALESLLAGEGLRLRLPVVQGVQVPSLVQELRSHMSHGSKTKT